MLIDGTGTEPVADSAIVINGDRFEAAGRAEQIDVPSDAMVIDATGNTVMPGIIEAHAHVGGEPAAQKVLRLSLQRGITTVCSVSANLEGIRLSRAIDDGSVRGCARLVAGCVVTPTHGHVKFRTADGPWEVRKGVREMAMAGAAFIKTAASGGFWAADESCSVRNYTFEELDALTDEAHAWNLPVIVHCHTQPGLNNCIRAGTDQIHHGAFIDEEAVRGIYEKGLFYVPTLAVTCQYNIDGYSGERPWMIEEMQQAQPIHREGVRLAAQLGVKLCVGTDYPGGPWWEIGERTMYEMTELVSCGLSLMQAIVAATSTNAEAFGRLDDLGTIKPGKKADLLMVRGNPLDNIGLLREAKNILTVIKDGVVEYTDKAHKEYYQVGEDQPPERTKR